MPHNSPPPRQVYHLSYSYHPMGCYADNSARMLPTEVNMAQQCNSNGKNCITISNLPNCAIAAKAAGCTVFGLQVSVGGGALDRCICTRSLTLTWAARLHASAVRQPVLLRNRRCEGHVPGPLHLVQYEMLLLLQLLRRAVGKSGVRILHPAGEHGSDSGACVDAAHCHLDRLRAQTAAARFLGVALQGHARGCDLERDRCARGRHSV